VIIEGRRTAPATISELRRTASNAWYEVTIIEGRHHHIRLMFDKIGHSVVKLKRVAIGFLTTARLKPGQYRRLSPAEVKRFFARERAATGSRRTRQRP
jgi:23S rRNA pseudouridine2605 synthase